MSPVKSRRPLRIVLACAHRLYRAGLAELLSKEPGFLVVGEAQGGAEAVRLARAERADVLLMDYLVLGASGERALPDEGPAAGRTRIILLSTPRDQAGVLEALRLGAWGVVLKDASPELLYRSIRTAAAGEAWVDRDTVSRLLESMRVQRASAPAARAPGERITPRERDIVREVANGATNDEIACKLGLQPQTVKNYLSLIFDKLGASSRLELALYAVHHGLTGGGRADAATSSTKVSGPD
jgi:two-component system nitrate/nitrite response regulator NarL